MEEELEEIVFEDTRDKTVKEEPDACDLDDDECVSCGS